MSPLVLHQAHHVGQILDGELPIQQFSMEHRLVKTAPPLETGIQIGQDLEGEVAVVILGCGSALLLK